MSKTDVEIFTDASFYVVDKVGGYAYQIRSREGLLKDWGPIDKKIYDPTEAEMIAVLYALNRVIKEGMDVSTLTINTDCEFIVSSMWTENDKRKLTLKNVTQEVLSALSRTGHTNLKIKHVKAHSKIINPIQEANNWCDISSRRGSIAASDLLHNKYTNSKLQNKAK